MQCKVCFDSLRYLQFVAHSLMCVFVNILWFLWKFCRHGKECLTEFVIAALKIENLLENVNWSIVQWKRAYYPNYFINTRGKRAVYFRPFCIVWSKRNLYEQGATKVLYKFRIFYSSKSLKFVASTSIVRINNTQNTALNPRKSDRKIPKCLKYTIS